MELREQQGGQIAKIGVNVLSFHCLEPYPGWAAFKPEIDTVLDFLFRSFQDFTATRLGFRYVNIFTREDHGIESTRDLNYTVSVAGSALESPQNLNYIMVCTEKHTVMVRIASPEFVVNATKPNIRALVDLDVFTPAGWRTSSVDEAKDWVEKAHECEKEQFFRLFTEEMKARLVEAQ